MHDRILNNLFNVCLIRDIQRTLSDVRAYSTDVFSDDSYTNQLNSSDKHNTYNHGGPTLYIIVVKKTNV